ncbi:acyl-CoA thioesterase [Nocardioides sp. BGMRC 2183]|nr:acyl-CoA thioesterase [Nocardioides sp. BGMRC 2183]
MLTVRHRYACPLRWGDMDLLGHVNNVRYVDYLQEARGSLLQELQGARRRVGPGEDLVEGIVVVRHEVTYLRPLHYGRTPVLIEVWVTRIRSASFTLGYEVFQEDDAGRRTLFLRATTVLAPYRFDTERPRRLSAEERAGLERYLEAPAALSPRPVPVRVRPTPERHTPLHIRFSDVDAYRHVNNVVYFEYFQEARIRLIADLAASLDSAPPMRVVVAQTDVDYHEALVLHPEPYDCWTRIAAVGSSSLTLESTITAPGEPERVMARARVVLVFFDPETERSAIPPDAYRVALTAQVSDD